MPNTWNTLLVVSQTVGKICVQFVVKPLQKFVGRYTHFVHKMVSTHPNLSPIHIIYAYCGNTTPSSPTYFYTPYFSTLPLCGGRLSPFSTHLITMTTIYI